MKKFTCFLAFLLSGLLLFAACSSGNNDYYGPHIWPEEETGSYDYESVTEQPFLDASAHPETYFSLDRNTAGYSLMRRLIADNRTVPEDSVRAEEFLNYFDYGYPSPQKGEDILTSTYLFPCPWKDDHLLMNIGIKTEKVEIDASAANYVFLIDVSGSMSGTDRIGLVKTSLTKLVESLGENDRIAIVTYASGVNTVLDSTSANAAGKDAILSAIDSLQAGGSTNGSGGIDMAYSIALDHYIPDGNNRVILMSDGDFNVGMTGKDQLSALIKEKAQSGIYLSVLGFGMGNTRDSILETLARSGNGNYAYIDNETEAAKVFEKDIAGMLVTVLKDAKAKIVFNAENVKSYRQIGYDTKLITEDQYVDPDFDAGEIGSNLCVSILFEIELIKTAPANGRLADLEISYKDVSENNADKKTENFVNNDQNPDNETSFIACVAEYALLLRNSQYKGSANFDSILSRLQAIESYLAGDPLKTEFHNIVRKASSIYSQV